MTAESPIFRGRPEHADLLGRLLYDFNVEFDTETPPADVFATRFRTLLARPDVLALVAGTEAAPTGFAYLTLRPTPYYDGPVAQLEELYVVPHLRSQGIGTALLAAAVRQLRDDGAGEIHINVDEVDTDARRFYERHGFLNIEPGTDSRMLCYVGVLDELPSGTQERTMS